ncbi:MAG: ROK family transcriptional regulator [Pseudomonadota bacterium]
MHQKTDSEFIRRKNRTLVLRSLRAAKTASRTDLSEETSLSPAALSGICGDLVREGLLVERRDQSPALRGRGRPRVALELNPDAAHVLAVEIGDAALSVALANYAGDVIESFSDGTIIETQAQSLPSILIERGDALLARANLTRQHISAVSIAVQGVADQDKGQILWSPVLEDRNIDVTGPMHAAFGAPVILSNDANMLARVLHFERPADYDQDFIVVMVDRGVGAGLFLNGTPFEGAFGAAAEFGHMNHIPDGPLCRCGRKGCLEAFVSDYGIYRLARGDASDKPRDRNSDCDLSGLVSGARDGTDERAAQAFADAGRALGFGLARLVTLFDPSRIALTGAALQAWDLLGPHCRKGFDDALVGDLSRNVVVDVLPWDSNYIRNGTILAGLAFLDDSVFSMSEHATD